MYMTQEKLRARILLCAETGLCFISMQPLVEGEGRSSVYHTQLGKYVFVKSKYVTMSL